MSVRRRLMVTVDVEAQPGRAAADHVDRLIWGSYPRTSVGIGEMMAIAERHGVALTMFLDYCEEDLYGEALRDVAREISGRGHDLELHAHPEFLPESFWSSRNLVAGRNGNRLTREQSEALVVHLCERHAELAERPAVAYRGGGYRFCAPLLDALVAHGIAIDSSVNVSRSTQPAQLPMLAQFRWSNGLGEVPITNVRPFRNLEREVEFNFNSSALAEVERLNEYLETVYRQHGDDAIAVLVLHSWSFQRLSAEGHFSEPDHEAVARFDGFISGLSDSVQVVTAHDLARPADGLRLEVETCLPLGALTETQSTPGASTPAASGPPAKSAARCPICDAAGERFEAMKGRLCPDCRSLERQRVLAHVYDTQLKDELDIRGMTALIVSPSVAERRLLTDRGLAGITSVDVRPEAGTDVVADICDMPVFSDCSQSLVLASYVMPLVHDHLAALDEVLRVLQPGGTFISVEPVRFGEPTSENSEPATITSWYGQEAFDRHRVGAFRQLGDLDYLADLQRRFVTKTFTARDPITSKREVVHVCINHGRNSP